MQHIPRGHGPHARPADPPDTTTDTTTSGAVVHALEELRRITWRRAMITAGAAEIEQEWVAAIRAATAAGADEFVVATAAQTGARAVRLITRPATAGHSSQGSTPRPIGDPDSA